MPKSVEVHQGRKKHLGTNSTQLWHACHQKLTLHCLKAPKRWRSIFAVLLPMVLNDSGHPLMTGGRVVKRTTSWCFANGQETGTIGVPAVPLLLLLLLLLLFLLILLLLLLVYRPSCANSIRRHCCWLVLLLMYCLLAIQGTKSIYKLPDDIYSYLKDIHWMNQVDEERVRFFEIPLTTSFVICAIPSGSLMLTQVPGSYWSPSCSCGIGHCAFLIWRLKYNNKTNNGTFSISRSGKHTNSIITKLHCLVGHWHWRLFRKWGKVSSSKISHVSLQVLP